MANDVTLGIKIKIDGKEVDGQMRLLTSDVNKLVEATRRQGDAAQESSHKTDEQTRALRKLTESSQEASDAVMSIGKSAAAAFGNVTGLQRDLEGLRTGFLRFAATVTVAGVQAAQAISFESAFADVKKVVEGSRSEIKKLETDLKSLSTAISLPLEGLAQIAAQGGQLGLPVAELREFTELVAKMSVGFNLLPEEAGNAIGTLRNVFKLTLPELERFGDQINTVADNANTSEREMLNLVTRVGDTAQQFGLLRGETLGLSAAILSLGKPPEVAATALENMLTSLRTADLQTDDFRSGLKALGIDARKLAQDIDKHPKQALDQFLQSLEALDGRSRSGVINRLFGKGQDAVVINQLISSLNEYRRIVSLASKEEIFSGSLARTFEEREKTVSAALQRMKNAFSVFSINVSDFFLPTIRFAADALNGFATSLGNVAQNSPNLTAFAQITAVMLPLAGAFRLLSFGIGLIAPAIGPAITALGSLISAASGLGILATVTAGVTGLVGVLGAFTAGTLGKLVVGVGAAALAFSGLGGAITGVASAILTVLSNPLTVLIGGMALVAIKIAGAGTLLAGLGAAAATVGRALLLLVGGPVGAAIAGLTFLGVKFLQVKDDAIEFAGQQTTVGGVIEAAWQVAGNAVSKAAASIGNDLSGMGNNLLALAGINDQTWNSIKASIDAAGQHIATFAKDAVNVVIRAFAGLASFVGIEFDHLISTVSTKFSNVINIARAAGEDIRAAFSGEFGVGNLSAAYAAAAQNDQRNLLNTTQAIKQSFAEIGRTDYVGILVDDFKIGSAEIGKNLKESIAAELRAGSKQGVKAVADEVRKTGGGHSLAGALGDSEKANNAAASAAGRAAKAEAGRRDEVAKTIEQIRIETSLIGLSDKARQRSLELTNALGKAKGAEAEAIRGALEVKWQELDADERRTRMWEELVQQANALDQLRDDAADAQRLAALAKELKLQGLGNEAIRDRIDLEQQLSAARASNPDLNARDVEAYVRQRTDAERELSQIIDNGSQASADFMETAFKRAAENIQDAMAEMFENLLNGDATGSFDDFLENIRRSMNKVFSQQLAASIQNWFKSAFTSGVSSTAGGAQVGGGMFSGIFDWAKGLFGGGSGSSAGSYFQGNGPLLSYQNPASSAGGGFTGMFSQLFSSGSGGGFSTSSTGGGGFGWGALASLANLIPGAGQVNWKGQQQNKSLQTVIGLENTVTDIVGNFFPLFKLIAPLKNMIMNFGAKLFPDRKPSLLGHMLGQALGPIGDLFGTFLLGKKIPQPTEWTKGYYSGGKMTVGKSGSTEGGNTQNTIDFTKSFGDIVTSLGHQLNMTFRDFRSTFWHQVDVKGDNQFAGWLGDKGGNFFTQTATSDSSFKQLANSASLALVKRNIHDQDDLHYREAIRSSKSLKKLSEAIAQIDQIGIVLGEYGQALSQLKEINAQFDEMAVNARKYRFAEADIEAARQRAIEGLKNETITAFRQLAGMGPTLAAQLGALRDQLIALEGNARSLKIAEADLLGLRTKAIAIAKEQYLSPLTDVSNSITDQIAQLTGVIPAAEDVAPLYQLLAASTDPTEQARHIDRIQRALTQRYNIEIAAINKTAQAVNGLKQFVDSLKLSSLSPLDPEQRLREAQGQYGTTLLKAQAGDQTAIGKLPDVAQSYLTEARNYYASTPDYAAIFSNVTDTLTSLGASLGGDSTAIDAQEAAAAAADTLAASLQSLSDVVQQILNTQGGLFDDQSGSVGSGVQSPAKNFQDITEDQMAANIDALPDDATKEQKRAVKLENNLLRAQIKAWLFGGDEELAKTQAYQELTAAINDVRDSMKGIKRSSPDYTYLKAQLSGLSAQRKALGRVRFKLREQGGWTDGPTIVGENGPELINFARPTQVINNRQTQSIIAGGNNDVVAELRKANEELQALVRLQAAATQAMLERLDSVAGSVGTIERKTRLKGAA